MEWYKNPKVIVGLGLGALWLSSSSAQARVAGLPFTGSASSRDVEAMARTLIAETSMNGPTEELAQIVWVMINRARRHGVSLAAVATPPGTPLWNGSSKFRNLWNQAGSSSKMLQARSFVMQVMGGHYPNRIGSRSHFVHPGGMPRPPCASNRRERSTAYGVRCLPTWSDGGTVVGRAIFA